MRWKYVLGIVLVLAAVCVALGFFWPFGNGDQALKLPGVVEIQEVRLGSKIGGRVEAIHVQEGDHVKAGDPLVTFEAPELRAQQTQLRAQVYEADLDLKKARDGPRPQEIEAARQAYLAAEARARRANVGYRQEEKDQARAELEAAEADVKVARQDYERISRLPLGTAITAAEQEASRANLDRGLGRAGAARAKLAMLLAGSREEDKEEAAAELRRTQANYDLLKEGTRKEDVLIAEQRVQELRAKLEEIEINLQEAIVTAREPCVIEVLGVRKADLVPPNQPILRILRDADRWVKVYVPETKLDRVHRGQAVEIAIDSGQRFTGKVIFVASESEFTPRNVQSADERRHQVFGVKIQPDDPKGILKPGMAAEVTFRD